VLGLRNRHAVTGHDDDVFSLLHHVSSVFGRATLPWALLFGLAASCRSFGTKTARNNAKEDFGSLPYT